jgi:hypothetical protein
MRNRAAVQLGGTVGPSPSIADLKDESPARSIKPKNEGISKQMRKVKIIGVTLVAVFALSALGAASASAVTPSWFKGGTIIAQGTTDTFTGSAGAGVLEAKGGLGTVKCKSDTSAGQITGPWTETKIVVIYKECAKGAKPCTSAGQAAGTIKTNEVSGTNIYLDTLAKGHTKAGIALKPTTGTVFVAFTCEGEVKNEVSGEVIGEALPLNAGTDKTEGTLTFVQAGGKQKWTQMEEAGTEKVLKAFSLIQSGIGGGPASEPLVETLKFKEAVELHKV